MPRHKKSLGKRPARSLESLALAALILALFAVVQPTAAQSTDDSQSHPSVSKSDVAIVQKARQILDSPQKWNRADNRNCPQTETTFSLYCALETATFDITGDFAHRGAAMQEARFVIDDDLAPQNNYDHRLMDYNNDPHTTFTDVQRFFDLLQGRIEGRLEAQENSQPNASQPAAAPQITPTDIEIVKKVESILDSPAKWDKASTQDCKPDATTFGIYCAFEAASIAVTGKFDDHAPGITETRQLISRTAPHAAQYSARLVDYNNDPTVTFADLQNLLKTVENNLRKRMSLQQK
jgi:hypothetical protein